MHMDKRSYVCVCEKLLFIFDLYILHPFQTKLDLNFTALEFVTTQTAYSSIVKGRLHSPQSGANSM